MVGIWHFGTDPAIHRPGFCNIPLHRLPATGDILHQVRGHYLAVSTTLLYGSWESKDSKTSGAPSAGRRALAFLRTYQPVDKTTTFFIYDFTQGDRPHNGQACAGPAYGASP